MIGAVYIKDDVVIAVGIVGCHGAITELIAKCFGWVVLHDHDFAFLLESAGYDQADHENDDSNVGQEWRPCESTPHP